MQRLKTSVVLALGATLLLSGCSSDSSAPLETSPEATESAAEPTPEVPLETVDFSVNEEFGITATGPELTDQFGTFTQVAVAPDSKVYTYAPGVIADNVITTFTPEQVAEATQASTNFLLTQYADSPLVWDDSAEIKDAFIEDTLPLIDGSYIDAFKEAFDSTTGYFIVDSNFSSWRTDERGLKPAPYEVGAPRYALTYFEVKGVTLFEASQGVRIDYEIVYERDVLNSDGKHFAEVNNVTASHVMNFSGPEGAVKLAGWESDASTIYVDRS